MRSDQSTAFSSAAASGLARGLPRHLHLLGAGGAGLSGAALILAQRGHVLTGHDRADSPFVATLAESGIPIALGPSRAADLPRATEAIVRSAAVASDDPQVLEALRRGLAVLKYSEVLPLLASAARTIGVAGTHGKTTTSWMLHEALAGARRGLAAEIRPPRPGALIGGTDRVKGINAIPPAPEGWFVAEACEYDRSFLRLDPRCAIVTNVEADHLDCYGTFEALEEGFARYLSRVHPDGLVVLGRDVPAKIEAAARCRVLRLGRELESDLLSEREGLFRFRLRGPGWAVPEVSLAVPGEFNVENAALALALAIELTAAPAAATGRRDVHSAVAEAAARELAGFVGAERRFEPWGTVGGMRVIHDYAHHPTEVRATLEAARRRFPGRPLHVLFQPHQHSRTARFLAEFVEVLRGVDRAVIADVYGARAHIDSETAGSPELVRRLSLAGVDAVLGGCPSDSAARLAEGCPEECAVLVLGAGDIDGIKGELLEALAAERPLESRPR